MATGKLVTGTAGQDRSGLILGVVGGLFWVGAYGATGNGTVDDTVAIANAYAAALAVGGTVIFGYGTSGKDTYRVTATLNVTGPMTILGAGATIIPDIPDADPGQVIYVSGSDVLIEGLNFDYTGRATGSEGNRYMIFAAGASNTGHIENVTVRNCAFTNIETGNYPKAVVAAHTVWFQWLDHGLVEDCFVSSVSGFGCFSEATNYVTFRNNYFINTGWASCVSNSGDTFWSCEENVITGTAEYNRDEGGSIALNGSTSDGYGPTIHAVVRNNYVTGSVAYGDGVRIGSTVDCELYGNVFDQITAGTSQLSGESAYAGVITVSTRGATPAPGQPAWQNVRIHHNCFVAPLFSAVDVAAAEPNSYTAIYAENADWSGGSFTGGRASNLIIHDNQFICASYLQAFTPAILVDGETAGIDNVDIHDNQVTGYCLSTALVGGMVVVAGGGGTEGTVTNVKIHDNIIILANEVPGTVNVINNSTGITFSQAQNMNSGDTLTFAGQPGTTYTLSGAVTGTSGTLSSPYTGTSAAATTATITNSTQIGVVIGNYTVGAQVHGNLTDSWWTRYLVESTGVSGVQLSDESFIATNTYDLGPEAVNVSINGAIAASLSASQVFNLPGLTASEAVVTDGSSNITTLAYTANNTDGTLALRANLTYFTNLVLSGDTYYDNGHGLYFTDASGYFLTLRCGGTYAIEAASGANGYTWYNAGYATQLMGLSETGTLALLQGPLAVSTGIGGNGTPFQWTNASTTLGHGGTTSLTDAQCSHPEIILTDSGLTSNSTVTFSTTTGPTEWTVDLTGVSFSAYTATLEVGTAAKTVIVAAPGLYKIHSDGAGKLYSLLYA